MERLRASRHLSLLSTLTSVQRSRLLSVAAREARRAGETLFGQGEPAESVWLVLEGWVHLIRSDGSRSNGRGVVIFTITPEEMLCGLSAMEGHAYNTTAVAATPCRLLRVPARAFNEALQESPPFAMQALQLAARRIRHIAQQYGSIAEPASRRLIRALLRLREQFGDAIPMTHRELAQMAWTSTETAIRVVRRLKQEGCLAGARGTMFVRDPRALERLVTRPEPSRSMTPVMDGAGRRRYPGVVTQRGRAK